MIRLINQRLDEWTYAKERKVLLLHGARQSGKTHLVNSFAQKFDQYLSFDLSVKKERKIFDTRSSLEDLLQSMFSVKGKTRNDGRTLVFLDNIKDSPATLRSLPLFYKEARDLFVIASASGDLSLHVKAEDDPDPIIKSLFLYPYNFSEFLAVLGEDAAREAYHEVPFPNNSFDKLIRFFHLYTLIGGMPEIAETFARDRELTDLPPVYDRIMASFMDEIGNAAPSKKTGELCRDTFQNSFPFASMRIGFNNFGNSARRSRETGNAFRLLEKIGLLQLVYPCVSSTLPLHGDRRKSPRLQILDTGIVNYTSDIQKQLFEADDLLSLFDGQIARQITGQELLASGNGDITGINFWVRDKAQSTAEVDFIIPYEDLVIPVVLKPGEPGRLRSLHQFMDAAPHPFAVRLWAHPLSIQQAQTIRGKKFFLMSLPYFLAGKIREHLGGFIKLVNG